MNKLRKFLLGACCIILAMQVYINYTQMKAINELEEQMSSVVGMVPEQNQVHNTKH